MKKLFQALMALIFLTAPAFSAPRVYVIDHDASQLNFNYLFNNDPIKGRFPDFTAKLLLDFKDFSKSDISLTIDTRSAKGGFVFATTALRGPKILHAKKFPTIHFQSKSIRPTDTGAELAGVITVRNISRPITLNVQFLKLAEQSAQDRNKLALRITGRLNRYDFGASGYPKMVGENLDIDVLAYISRKP
jgi:polyisoprenoid-binding protein YceI